MPGLTIKRVDTFSTTPFKGNPAGVICGADSLSKAQMQDIAKDMILNMVEYVFITSPTRRNADFMVHFFTPERELEISGHAVLAACFSLMEDGLISMNEGLTTVRFQTGIGIVPIEIFATRSYENCSPEKTTNQPQPQGIPAPLGIDNDKELFQLHRIMLQEPLHNFKTSPILPDEIAEALGIGTEEITNTGLPVALLSYEFDWLLIPILNRETLYNMSPDLIKLSMMNRKYGVKTNHLFTLDSFSCDCIAYSRHFGPLIGLWEDPATAIASAMLSVYLIRHGITSSTSMQIEQGNDADSLARIFVDVEHVGGEVRKLRVGGTAVTSIKRDIHI